MHAQKVLVSLALLSLVFMVGRDLTPHEKWGMDVIEWLQQFRSSFSDRLMKSGSLLGFEFVVPLVPFLIFHGASSSRLHALGLDILSMLMYTLCCMSILKLYFKEDRPLWSGRDFLREATGAAASGKEEFSFPSGHAWATCAYWLLVTERFSEYRWVAKLAVLAILQCALSRVWFAMHYPHDVMVGIALGVLFYMWRRWFLVFCPEKRRRHEVAQLATWVTLTLVGFGSVFEHEQIKNQKGLTFSLGALMSCIVLRDGVQRVMDNPPNGKKWSNRRIHMRRIARMVIGCIPIMIMMHVAEKIVMPQMGRHDIKVMFSAGAIAMFWLLWLAPHVWEYIGLSTGTVSSREHHNHHLQRDPQSPPRSASPARRRKQKN